jgi:hypothetical protein
LALFNFLRFIMISLAFNLIFVPQVIKIYFRFKHVCAFMLVHGFTCLSVVWFEFKIDLNSN